MKINNKRDFMVKISGNHYFACDYVFANVYGDSVFIEEPENALKLDGAALSLPFTNYDESVDDAIKETLPETPLEMLSTLPDCTKEIEYMTEGTVSCSENGELYIRYGNDEYPMCIHIRNDGVVTLSGDESDVAEFVFEKGKRNFIALPESAFKDTCESDISHDSVYEKQSPIYLCVSTEDINNNMTNTGGSLQISYSIEVNGIVAEVTDFTITADSITG